MARYFKGATQATLALQLLMGLGLVWWWVFWFTLPIEKARDWLRKKDSTMNQDFLGVRGSTWLLQIFPWIFIAVVAYAVIELRKRIKPAEKSTNSEEKPKISIWSQPIILKSPLGRLTLAEIIFIILMVFLIVWYTVKMCVDRARLIDNTKQKPGSHSRSAQKLEYVGVILGKASLIPFTLLWIPVSRASPLLRVTGIPFERAVKYHTWLGIACVWTLIAHGVVFLAYFPSIHHTSELLTWDTRGIAYFPGIVALSAGVLMLATALEKVRREKFNLFFITHHLYLVFFLFFLFHCQSQMVYVVIPILLFFLDRFMRMVQSRKAVDVLSTRVLPSGAIELKFAKPANFEYNALSFMFVLFPNVSKIEWHPFSVASSPLDGSNQICVYIKPLGSYTKTLHDALVDSKAHKDAGKLKCPFGFKLSVEGPYGDESEFYLKYKALVLVAGGIGVTPFLAIVRDILHRHRLQQEDLPTSIQLIFCVRNEKDLCLLDTLNPEGILPGYKERLQITVHAYVTSKVEQPEQVQSAEGCKDVVPYEDYRYTRLDEAPVNYYGPPLEAIQGMSVVGGSGDTKWVAATVFATLMGYVIIWGVFNQFIDNSFANYSRALLYCVAIALAVCVCGGAVMFFWNRSAKKYGLQSSAIEPGQSLPPSPIKDHDQTGDIESAMSHPTPWEGTVTLGKRPNWKGVFDEFVNQYKGRNVGVLVSGGARMQEDIAAECKHHSTSKDSGMAFHYHSVSFEL